MKRNNLTTAVIAGIAGVAGIANMAGAVNLNPDGLGQVLIYPYFTVNANNQTLLSVVNTQNAGKAVKVRFLEGYDSREVLDFNLYLSPYDVWTATVFDTSGVNGRLTNGSAEAAVLTPDESCTDPAIKHGAVGNPGIEQLPDGRNFAAFVNSAYSGSNDDGGPQALSRTRTGHIELIEMATVVGATLTNIKHVNGVPPGCKSVIGATGGADYLTPTGGLFGTGSIVNPLAGTLYGYNADAVDGFYTNTGNLFNAAGTIAPDLTNGDNTGGVETSYVFNNGKLITSSWLLSGGGSIDAVSSVFTADHIYNEYELNPASGSVASEWVVTFPTKRYYVDPTLSSPVPPFTVLFGDDSTNAGTACEKVGLNEYDREERTPQRVTGFSPPRPGANSPVLCWEAQVITFQSSAAASASTASPIFGSPLFTNVDTLHDLGASGTSGWVNITLAGAGHLLTASREGNVFSGLPVTGFLAKDFTNKNVTPGILGNYAGLYRHRTSRTCTNTNGVCS